MSVLSCLIRNDYNVIFAFFILMILNKFYINNTSFFTKLIIHLLVVACIADLIWLLVMWSFWGVTLKKNPYWEGLSGIHSFGLFMGILEIGLKVINAANYIGCNYFLLKNGLYRKK